MRFTRVTLLLVVFGSLMAACEPEVQPRTITATDFAFSGVPESISGGVVDVTFRNEGQATHELGFLNLGDEPFESFKRDFPGLIEGGPFPKYFRAATGLTEVEAGKSLSGRFTLPKGKYLLFCALDDAPGEGDATGPMHYELGMHQTVTVEGPEDAGLDAPGGTFRAMDYTFEAAADLEAGQNEFAFVNDGPKQWHFMDVQVFPQGTTAAQAEQAFATLLALEEDAPPPEGVPLPEDYVFTGVFSPGQGQTFEANFESGRTYLMACFIHDLAGGPPHAIANRMYKAFTVQLEVADEPYRRP